jgi:crotonobetainyl-CoA:carnitine CoA-transferase CaiB-like acyl-CoA transferase
MAGVLDGIRVLDLTRGIAGPMTGMLLADYGADVVRIEPPGGDGLGHLPGYVVWNRGKRRVALDLKNKASRDEFLRMVERADVLLESYRPGVTSRLGIDYDAVKARNERLIYASITGYGRDNPHSDRPGIEWLVTARAGMQWDQRSYYGTRMDHIMGEDLAESGFPVPPGAEQTGCREGPIFLALPWASLGAMLTAITGISAALYVRQRTGKGQMFETSLLQAVLIENMMGWQRVAKTHPSYRLWYFDRRAPKGIFRTSDGQWLHQWAPIEHDFIRENARVAATGSTDVAMPKGRTAHRGASYEEDVEFQATQFVESAKAIATLPRDEWARRFAVANLPAQPILSPEQGLLDKPLEKEGVVVEIDDPEFGRIRQVGHTYTLEAVASPPIRPRSLKLVEPASIAEGWTARTNGAAAAKTLPRAPLEGVLALDFGLAVAGPYGAQVLADFGATVIKVTAIDFSLTDAIYVGSSHGKLALALDLKNPRGLEIAQRLIAKADIVHHNMRTGVAERLGIGYAQAEAINPRIVYCHTRGFEKDGPRTPLPGNDQMGHALAGSAYEGGGTHHGTAPIWHITGFGDTGNGILSANACIQALLHREKTGKGQFVHTSILNVAMLFNSYTYVRPDGTGPDRERIDAKQYGFSATRRLFETRDGWICVYARHDDDWANLRDALGLSNLASDARFADAAARAANDAALSALLEPPFRARSAQDWFATLDAMSVPCEIASSNFARELFDDPAMYERGWVVRNPHAHLQQVEQVGMAFSFSATAGKNLAGTPVTGQHSRQILVDLGYSAAEIEDLIATRVVGDQQPASA